jgi:peptidoglycan hydrolase CwlO-like protein
MKDTPSDPKAVILNICEIASTLSDLTKRISSLENDLATAESDLRAHDKKIERLESSLRDAHNEISHLGNRRYEP